MKSEMATVGGVGTSLAQIRVDQKSNAGTAPKGTISLRHLAHKIPKPARKEYEKGRSLRQRPQIESWLKSLR